MDKSDVNITAYTYSILTCHRDGFGLKYGINYKMEPV